jgi:spermidine/putrescine-binding protein
MTRHIPRSLLGLALFAAGATASQANPAEPIEKTVNIYFWYEYVPPSVITAFERETGIKVVYDTFEQTEMLTTKVLSGKTGYDIVMPTASATGRLIEAGALRKLDAAKLPNAKDLNPDILRFIATQDPGNAYTVPYAYGTTGIMFNPKLIADRMTDAPVASLDMIFDPKIAAHFKDCASPSPTAPRASRRSRSATSASIRSRTTPAKSGRRKRYSSPHGRTSATSRPAPSSTRWRPATSASPWAGAATRSSPRPAPKRPGKASRSTIAFRRKEPRSSLTS